MDKEQDLILSDIENTKNSLGQKLNLLEGQVRGTVEEAKNSVQDTIESIKTGVESVKQTFDPIHQTQEHPWVMLGGSVVTGLVVGSWIARRPQRAFANTPGYLLADRKQKETGFTGYRPSDAGSAPEVEDWNHPDLSRRQGSHLWDLVKSEFGDEIKMIKNVALVALVNAVGKRAITAFPQMERDIKTIVDSATKKMGADPSASETDSFSRADDDRLKSKYRAV